MVHLRAAKVAGIAKDIPPVEVRGDEDADLLVSGGARRGVPSTPRSSRWSAAGPRVAWAHLVHLNPFPPNLGEVVRRYPKVLVPEMNLGQLCRLVRAEYLVDAQSVTKVEGTPVHRRRARTIAPDGGSARMTSVATRAAVTSKKDWTSDQEVRWCRDAGTTGSSCGPDAHARARCQARRRGVRVGHRLLDRFPYYMNTYGIHGIHGRAPAIATGSRWRGPTSTCGSSRATATACRSAATTSSTPCGATSTSRSCCSTTRSTG